MVNKSFIVGMCCLFSFPAVAQDLRTSIADAFIKTEAYSSTEGYLSLLSGNVASLGRLKNFSAILYGERRYMLQDLGLYHAGVILPSSTGNFGLSANYFGGSYYSEMSLGLAYARQLGSVDAGIQFNYQKIKSAAYDVSASVNVEAGFIYHLSDQLQTGIHIYNPVELKNHHADEKLPLIFSSGLGYNASDKFYAGFAIEKIEDCPVDFNAGFNYSFDKKLMVRAGISSATTSFYFGAGILLNDLRIDITASLHPQLGITPGLMLLYNPMVKP